MKQKKYRAFSIHNYQNIPQCSVLKQSDHKTINIVGSILPFKTNNYVTDELIDWSNIEEDPIFTLNFPRQDMLLPGHYNVLEQLFDHHSDDTTIKQAIREIREQLNPNPSGQEYNVPFFKGHRLNGMQHKYRETVLLFPYQGQTCHAYCTFCFRWPQFSGNSVYKFVIDKQSENLYLSYIKEHREVTDVLLTGSDPMTMNVSFLSHYIEPFLTDDFKQIQTIRLGTKSLAFWPYRFLTDTDSDDILRLFEKVVKAGKNLALMAHFSHPVELSTETVQRAISRIRSTGAQIRTQSPILHHINDNPDLWAQMWRKQVNLGCIPYYMFVARDTGANHFFNLPLEQCWNIFREAYQQVSGVCRTVRGPSMSANPGKIQILGISEINNDKVFILRFIQGRNPDWVARPFFAQYNSTATWFNELKPAFDKSSFFFESE